MSLRSNSHLKLVGIAGASALAIGAIAAPSLAASQDINYSCTVLGPTSVGIDPGTLPATMVAGQTSSRTMNMVVHLTSAQADLARNDTVSGTTTATGAAKSFPFKMTIPSQTIPATGAADITASGPGKIRPLSAGTWTVKAGDFSASLTISGIGTVPSTCTAPTDTTTHYGTIAVSKDKTTTAVTSASYSKTKKATTAVAKVKSHFGLKPTGSVKFFLKKGTHTLKSVTGKVTSKGTAKAVFKKALSKGKYTVTGKYLGNSNLKGSTSKPITFKVS